MKKMLCFCLLFSALVLNGYSQAYEGTVKYDKKTQRAIMMDYAYTSEAVENAFVQKISAMGYKPKEEKGLFNSDKGFIVFKNAYITDISEQSYDYIFKVERKSRKDDDQAIIYMIISKGDQNALQTMDAEQVRQAKSFLANMIPDIEAASLELQIKAQEDVVAKAEKKLDGLKDDQASLEKKLDQNKKDQEDTVKDIEKQKETLETLMGRRKQN